MCISRISNLQRWRLGGIYSPLGKTSRCHTGHVWYMSDMTYIAPTVTKLQWCYEASELPMNAGTSDRRNFRPSAHLKTTVTELKYVRCRNSRLILELPTIGTPDSRRNSRPSRHLKTSRWPLAVHTGHVQYDQDSKLLQVS